MIQYNQRFFWNGRFNPHRWVISLTRSHRFKHDWMSIHQDIATCCSHRMPLETRIEKSQSCCRFVFRDFCPTEKGGRAIDHRWYPSTSGWVFPKFPVLPFATAGDFRSHFISHLFPCVSDGFFLLPLYITMVFYVHHPPLPMVIMCWGVWKLKKNTSLWIRIFKVILWKLSSTVNCKSW